MAAGQQKRRLNGVFSISSNGIQEQHAEKRKNNLELSRWYRRMRPHIALEWDEAQKKAVARHAQVGITWRQLSPFSEPCQCHSRMDLADVLIVSEELYELKNIEDVLSYEVWQTCLSDSERKLLSEFLPKGFDAENVVQSLLFGSNFHFGNPLLTWGSSLCHGDMHPDALCLRDFEFRASKKGYYSELQNYHNNMLDTLQRWKQTWKSCKNPEREFLQKIWRCSESKDTEHAFLPQVKENENSYQNGKCAVDESCSSIGDKKVQSDDEKHEGENRTDGSYARQGSKKRGITSLQERSEGAETGITGSQKQENMSSDTFESDETGRFMTCLKISRKQHASILKMKQTGEELKLDSLGTIFGDIKNLDLQSLSTFEEPEKKKMLEYWLVLIERDLPVVHAKFMEGHLQRHLCRKSLGKEFLEKQQLMLYTAIESRKTCNLKEGPQHKKETDLLPVTNPSSHTNADIEDLEQLDPQSVHANTQSYSHNGSSSETGNSTVMGEPFVGHSLGNSKSLPVQKLNECCTTSTNMESEAYIPEPTKSAEHGSCILETENPNSCGQVSLESNELENRSFTDNETVCRDDEVSLIKDMQPANVGSQEFHSQDAVGLISLGSDNFLGKQRSNFWEQPKPIEEMCDYDCIRQSVVRDEPEKRTSFNLEKSGTELDVEHQQIHMSQRDKLAEHQRSSFLVHTDVKATTEKHVLHLRQPLSPENPTGEPDMQPFDQRQDSPNLQIVSLGIDNRFTHVSDLSLRQPQQSEALDHPFKLGNERFEEQQRQLALPPVFSDHLSKKMPLPNMQQSNGGQSLFISSPHVLQARGRQLSLNQEINQVGHKHSIPSDSVKGQMAHGFQHVSGIKQELQFLTCSKSNEQQFKFQQRELMQSGKQEGITEQIREQQIFRQNLHHENQPYGFQNSQQNQPWQHSNQQDLFPSGHSPAIVPSWPDPLQVAPCRSVPGTTTSQFGPQSGHWNGTESQFHASWSSPELLQRISMPGHALAGNSDEGKLFASLPQWDRLPQSTYGTLNHDHHGNLKSYVSSACSHNDNCHGLEDWTRFQYSNAYPPYNYPHERGSPYRASLIPWINMPPGTYPNPQISHFRQQSSGWQDQTAQKGLR